MHTETHADTTATTVVLPWLPLFVRMNTFTILLIYELICSVNCLEGYLVIIKLVRMHFVVRRLLI